MSTAGLASSIQPLVDELTDGAAEGTGILKLVPLVKKMLGVTTVPSYLVTYALGQQHSVFGSYPSNSDVAPSAIFAAIFFVLMIAHLFVFSKNYSRGHKFWLTIGFAFNCALRFIGFAMRISWSKDVQRLKIGLASSVFLIIPIVFLASFNLVLAQRIFTWKHPHIGSTRLFWNGMILIYVVVVGVVVMAILGAILPYCYFMSEHRFHMCKQAVQAAAVFCVLYVLTAVTLLIAAFVIPASAASKDVWTYQPWWIESFNPFYFVRKGACRDAERTFAERDPDAVKAVRIIPSTTHHANTLEKTQSVTSSSGKLDHNHSIFVICFTTLLLLISSIFRCVSCFMDQTYSSQSWIYKPVVMYVMFGAFETIINVIYLVWRVDLRFYRPDKINPSIVGTSRKGSATGPLNENADTLNDTRSREDKPYSEVAHNDHSSTE